MVWPIDWLDLENIAGSSLDADEEAKLLTAINPEFAAHQRRPLEVLREMEQQPDSGGKRLFHEFAALKIYQKMQGWFALGFAAALRLLISPAHGRD